MASIDQLETALRNADAAGDAGAAQQLAQAITDMRASPQSPNIAQDITKSAGAGLVRGTAGLVGFPGDVGSIGRAAGDYLANKVGISPESVQGAYDMAKPVGKLLPVINSLYGPTTGDVTKAAEGLVGDLHKPETTYGKYAQSVGEMVPALMLGPGGVWRKAGQAAGAGLTSEAAGQLTKGSQYEPYARVAGAMVGSTAPDMLRRVVTPNPISADRQQLVDTLKNEGVTSLTAGQRTGNKTLQYAESILGDAPGSGQGATKIQQRGQQQFTEAALKRAGAGPNAMPEVLAENQIRLGDEFKNLSARNTLNYDSQFAGDIHNAIKDYARVPPSQQKAIVDNYISDIAGNVGGMSGINYQEMRSRLSRQAQGLKNSDPTLSDALRNIRNALDSAMGRSISPADKAAWETARRQYAGQKIIESAASRAGEATAEGQIVPSNLRNAVTAQNRGAYARGQGDFAGLARAGSALMAPLPNSGTGQRVAIHTLATLLGGGAGTLGGPVGIPIGAALAGATAPAAMGRVLMTPKVQGYLANQLAGKPSKEIMDATRLRGLVQALMARNQVPQLAQ